MKSLVLLSYLLSLGSAAPQRGVGGCGCREVICPNQGPDHCACINAAADDCQRYQRGDCPAPPRCNDQPGNNGQRPPGGGPGGGYQFSTIYTTMPVTYTVTTTLPGFYSPRPVTSYSTIVSMVTVTLSQSPPSPGQPGWGNPGQQPSQQPQTIWQTTTVMGVPPPWSSQSRTPTRNPPSTTTIRPSPTQPKPSSTTRPTSTPQPKPPTSPYTPPWSTPPTAPPNWTPSAPSSTSTRPQPWTPSFSTGPTWTPIQNPTIPVASPTPVAPTPTPIPQPSSTISSPIPADTGAPPPPILGGGPQKCGPGQAKCPDGTYCDPQPLCSIGEDCAGVCLPTFNTRNMALTTQPWSVRRLIWQDLLDSGNYSIYAFNG